MTQAALGGIALLFWHYTLVVSWVINQIPRPDLQYLHYTSLYDGLVEILLGFGMVILGTDSVRRELETKNRELAETNKRLEEASEELAVAARTDPLTGLLNRRGLDAMLGDSAGRSFAGSLAVVDMNDLKKLNDSTGHAAGDAAILHVARAPRDQFRVTDPIFRTGGDEFLVILEGAHSMDLANRMAALDNALRSLPYRATSHRRMSWSPGASPISNPTPTSMPPSTAPMSPCTIAKSKRKLVAVG